LPSPLLRCLALSFLGGKDGLALNFSLAGNLGEPLGFGLTRGLCGFGGLTGDDLRRFLAAAFGFLFLTATFGGGGFFGAKAGLFTSLSTRCRKIAILGPVQISP
jgi:hypothetical protein